MHSEKKNVAVRMPVYRAWVVYCIINWVIILSPLI